VGPGALLSMPSGGSRNLNRTLENQGTIDFNGLYLYFGSVPNTPVTLNNQAGAVFNADGNGSIVQYYGAAHVFNNAGTFNRTGTGSTIVDGIAFNNTGTVNLTEGTLELREGGTHTGTFNVAAGTTLSWSGNHIAGGTAVVNGPGKVRFVSGSQTFGGRFVDVSMLDVVSATVAVSAGAPPVETAGLSIGVSGRLDLGTGKLIMHSTADGRDPLLSEIGDWIRSARGTSGVLWKGSGISSSAARLDARQMTALGAIINDNGGGVGAIYSDFGGRPVGVDDVLVKYTWYGDANLDGVVNADDYFLVDSGFITQIGGWYNGDFNYDGSINADDYFLIDSAFIGQTGKLSIGGVRLSTVPEPSLLGIAIFGTLGFIRCRRHGRQQAEVWWARL
jgi:hypothetical protein